MEHVAEVAVALLTLAGLVFTSFFAFLGAKHAKSANAAVNHSGEEGHRIYQLATNNHTMGQENQQAIERVDNRLDKIEESLRTLCK